MPTPPRALPILLLVLAACGQGQPEETPSVSQAALDLGQQVFQSQCAVCHAHAPGAGNRVGPNLYGVVGRAAGEGDFAYSFAMQSSGLVWDEPTLRRYLEAPSDVVAGTSMAYPGLQSAQDRAAVVSYLAADAAP
nr:c-type cytochrome [Parvularcula dongshanensis]